MARDPAQRQRLGRPRQQQLATCIDERLSHMVLGLRAACPPPWRDVCCVDPETSGQSVLSCPLPRRERTKAGRHATRFRLSEHCYHNRSEEHTSELQSLLRTSYADFCLKKKNPHSH